jgi:nucleotide-binding universal stress UspA family protein
MDIRKRFERILLATDGSEQSQAAVDATIAIAKSPTVVERVTDRPVLVAERVVA